MGAPSHRFVFSDRKDVGVLWKHMENLPNDV